MNYYRMNPRLKKSGGGNKTMTVILDLTNPDPTQWASYADDAVGMVAGSDAWDEFFGHYPCILDNGVELGKLKRDNFAQYEDGTTAPITTLGKDVMICFPRRGIKLEYTDENTLSVSMTNEEGKTGYSYMAHSYKGNDISKFYLGAYKGYVSLNNLYSTSGQTPTGNVTIGNFRTYAQARGTGYEQSAFFQLTFRQVMYLLKYKGQNAQIAVGQGFTASSNSAAHATGGTNQRGMDWGENTGTDQMKLFGMEDFYGSTNEFIDGVYANVNRQIYVADGNYNDTGSNYTSAGTSSYSSNVTGYLRFPNGTNLGGFTNGKTIFGTNTTYFCDSADVASSGEASFGGAYNNTLNAGVFRLDVVRNSSNTFINVGSRLMYLPTT